MCGFFASNSPSVNDSHFDTIRNRINFRGPDGESMLIQHHGWRIYHARLAIIAPDERYNQPYFNDDGSVILFNGEILNYRDLSYKYNIDINNSDTHVLSELLKNKLFDMNELEGFYAFIRIDKDGLLTHCARDRFGVKPLNYYKEGDRTISISSEASALSDIFDLPLSKKSLQEYNVFRAPIFQGSFYKNVECVKPGTCIIKGKFFDSLDYVTDDYDNIENTIENLDIAIKKSIDSRMISDVPVGLLYSGGIDSNLINHYSSVELNRYTGGFPGDYDMEFAKNSTAKSNIIKVNRDEFIDRFNSMIEIRKEPLSVPNEIILSFLAGAWSKTGGKVLLSGEAADELFGGYDRIYSWAVSNEEFNVETFLSLYAYEELSKIDEEIIYDVRSFFETLENLSVFEKVRQFFIKIHLPILFRRLDFALMYSGVEGREPLASSMIFEVAMKANPKNLFKNDLGKFPLRYLISKKINKEFAFKPKVGFPIDLGDIFNGIKTKNRHENYNIWQKENLRRVI